ncbi:PadR family transcriptional regulator [Kribbella antibiotica]|uniref:PadR family transcriptional regulator n=2 Tax=Kribbella antibiotica TaxID=190195 RepID=A0A4R4ZMF1_9ACTN|nr:PadR family transcriptional regulator [Kribbella antibiotica]
MTLQTQLILQALLREPAKESWGRKLADETGLMPGTAQPILMRLEAEGWLTSRREDEATAHGEGRPPRRYFALTGVGATLASEALTTARRPRGSALRDLATDRGAGC